MTDFVQHGCVRLVAHDRAHFDAALANPRISVFDASLIRNVDPVAAEKGGCVCRKSLHSW